MLYNDISNKGAKALAFRIEDFLVEFNKKDLVNKLLSPLGVINPYRKARLNPGVVSALEFIYKKTDMTVDLIVDEKFFYNDDLNNLLEGLPFSEIVVIVKPVNIAVGLNTKRWEYYIDNDIERMNIIGTNKCLTLKQFNYLVRGI